MSRATEVPREVFRAVRIPGVMPGRIRCRRVSAGQVLLKQSAIEAEELQRSGRFLPSFFLSSLFSIISCPGHAARKSGSAGRKPGRAFSDVISGALGRLAAPTSEREKKRCQVFIISFVYSICSRDSRIRRLHSSNIAGSGSASRRQPVFRRGFVDQTLDDHVSQQTEQQKNSQCACLLFLHGFSDSTYHLPFSSFRSSLLS